MEEDPSENLLQQELTRQYYRRELRSLELIAYSELLSAFRASGGIDENKRNTINLVREALNIPEERHRAEARRVACDERLGLIADMVTGRSTTVDWTTEGYTLFPPLPHIVKYIPYDTLNKFPRNIERTDSDPAASSKTESVIEITDIDESEIPENFQNGWAYPKSDLLYAEKPSPNDNFLSSSSESSSSDDELFSSQIIRRNKNLKKTLSPVKPTVVPDRKTSPDITDTPISPMKRDLSSHSNQTISRRGRGAKRKIPISTRPSTSSAPPSKTSRQVQRSRHQKPKSVKKGLKPRSRESSTSSAASSSSVESSKIKQKLINPVLPANKTSRETGRGRGLGRIRGRGLGAAVGSLRGRGGRGRGRGAAAVVRSPVKASPKMSKLKTKLSRPLKTKTKQKKPNPNPVVSRRKSKLKEKPIDEMVVEVRNYDEDDYNDVLKKEIDIKSRNFYDNNSATSKICKPEEEAVSPYKEENASTTVVTPLAPSEIVSNDNVCLSEDKDSVEERSRSDSEDSMPSSPKEETTVIPVAAAPVSKIPSSDDNDNENSTSDTETYAKSKNSALNTQVPNPVSPYSINQSTRELSPPQKQHKQRLKTPGINHSPGLINPIPRNPLPAPVFSTSLNMNSFNKKRIKLLSNSVVDSLNLHLPPGSSAAVTSIATASGLAARRPTIISSGGMYSNSTVLSSGRTPGILHPQRKAQPHILSTSKAHRNFIPNCTINNNTINTNINITSSASGNGGNNTLSNSSLSNVGGNTVQVQPNQNFGSAAISAITAMTSNSSAVSVQNFSSPVTTLTMANAIPLGPVPVGVGRSQGTNIIFLQKASSSSTGGSSASLASTVVPGKNSPRAVILRRAQIPRQGNVMILDMQKNQMVNASQVPQFLQTARILSAPGELSVLNIPGGQTSRKIIQTTSSTAAPSSTISSTYSTLSTIESPFRQPNQLQQQTHHQQQSRKTRIFTQQSVVVSSSTVPVTMTLQRATANIGSISPSKNPSLTTTVASTQNCVSVAVLSPMVTSKVSASVVPLQEPTVKIQPLVVLGGNSNITLPVSTPLVADSIQCPIEAELMQMEHDIVYEEEVVTTTVADSSSSECNPHSSIIPITHSVVDTNYGRSSISNKVVIEHQPISVIGRTQSMNYSISNTPPMPTAARIGNDGGNGSSTDTASESDCSFSSSLTPDSSNRKPALCLELSEVTTSTTSIAPSISKTVERITTVIVPAKENVSQILTPPIPVAEEIVQAALKSSGIVFSESQFYENEEESSTNTIMTDSICINDTEVISQVEVVTTSTESNISSE